MDTTAYSTTKHGSDVGYAATASMVDHLGSPPYHTASKIRTFATTFYAMSFYYQPPIE